MITSTSNAQIKELAKLQKKSRLRDEKGIFLVEGPRMTEEIPAERIEKVYASESFAKKNKEFLEKLQAPVELLTDPADYPTQPSAVPSDFSPASGHSSYN